MRIIYSSITLNLTSIIENGPVLCCSKLIEKYPAIIDNFFKNHLIDDQFCLFLCACMKLYDQKFYFEPHKLNAINSNCSNELKILVLASFNDLEITNKLLNDNLDPFIISLAFETLSYQTKYPFLISVSMSYIFSKIQQIQSLEGLYVQHLFDSFFQFQSDFPDESFVSDVFNILFNFATNSNEIDNLLQLIDRESS